MKINKKSTITYNQLFDEKYEIGLRLQDINQAFPAHYHDYIEIVCQLDGESKHLIDGHEYILRTSEILIINPKQIHENIATDSTVVNIILSTKFLTNLIIESAFDDDVITLKSTISEQIHEKVYHLDIHNFHILKEMYYHFTNHDSMYYLHQKALLTCFLIDFHNKTKFKAKSIKQTEIDLISYIQNNIRTASLNEYASMCNYSPSLLSQKIKAEYNITFIEILQDLRLKMAANLLISTKGTIESIMEEVGYQNRTHFYTLFKNKYLLTPSAYKKQHRL